MFALLKFVTKIFVKNFVSNLLRGYPDIKKHEIALTGVKRVALYVHIPFCLPPLCKFCSFVRYPSPPVEILMRYYLSVMKEAEMYAELMGNAKVGSIYIGGGTPTVCIDCLVELIGFLRDLFGRVPVTVEANPRTVTTDDLIKLKESGVVRISIGVQSFQKWKLDALGRYENNINRTKRLIIEAIKIFDTVNIDVVWGIKNETKKTLIKDATEAFELGPHQVTFYPIMPPLLSTKEIDKLECPPIKREINLYATLLATAIRNGYQPETPWCMVKEEKPLIDEYVTEFQDFVGLGVSSIGKLGNYVYVNTFVPNKYMKLITKNRVAIARSTTLSTIEQTLFDTETTLFGLHKPLIRGGFLKEALCILHTKAYELLEMGKKPNRNVLLLYALHMIQKTLYSGINTLRKIGIKYKI